MLRSEFIPSVRESVRVNLVLTCCQLHAETDGGQDSWSVRVRP